MNIVIIDDEILLSKNIEKQLVKQEYSVQKIHNYKAFI
jgi:DNA-binding response OmpR family regulator